MDVDNVDSSGPARAEGDLSAAPFPYEVELVTDIAAPVPVTEAGARIEYSLRQMGEALVEVDTRKPKTFNFGIRLHPEGEGPPVFESRAFQGSLWLQHGVWAPAVTVIPPDRLKNKGKYVLVLDFVKEDEFWFAHRTGIRHTYAVRFSKVDDYKDLFLRVDNMEQQLVQIRREIDLYTTQLRQNTSELASTVEEARAFQKQIPQFLNAISTANAASRIVGDARSALNAESGSIAKSLNEFRRELDIMRDALDLLAERVDPDRAANRVRPLDRARTQGDK